MNSGIWPTLKNVTRRLRTTDSPSQGVQIDAQLLIVRRPWRTAAGRRNQAEYDVSFCWFLVSALRRAFRAAL
ncbi:hypothetical protein [Roseateles albus]|uniref:hypothetical protein n=1 Tax=Roseateles albus TaxID=2987525 RepID=UPI0023583895|nr:hypothetical protein [Roseateles albus]